MSPERPLKKPPARSSISSPRIRAAWRRRHKRRDSTPSLALLPSDRAREGVEVSVRVGHKPSSVPMPWASVMIIPLGRELPHASSDLPGSLGRATLSRSPIWSCSGWGLPSQPGRPSCWWSLTPPFHPCLCLNTSGTRMRARRAGHRRSALCGTLRRVTPPGCYPATRSAELGLSSGPNT